MSAVVVLSCQAWIEKLVLWQLSCSILELAQQVFPSLIVGVGSLYS